MAKEPHRFKKGEPRPKNAGRRKGTPNKFTTVKASYLEFMERNGGAAFLEKIAKTPKGRIAVLNNISKLLPNKTELSGPDGGPIKTKVNVAITFVSGAKKEE